MDRLHELEAKRKKEGRLSPEEWKEYQSLKKKGGKEISFKPGNDIAWWKKYPELLDDASNLKCNWIAGTPLIDSTVNPNLVLHVPGVMRVNMINTYGAENDITGAINLAARNLYLKMFQKYRGVTAYGAPDLGICFIATIEVIQVVTKLERIYGIINRYDILNRNAPRVLTQALGISDADADYIRAHLADFRYDLNNIILKAQRILIPKDMSILLDRISLYGYVYKDHQSERAQYIVFDYNTYGLFDETSMQTGGCVRFEPATYWNTPLIQTSDPTTSMFPLLNKLVEALLSSDSINKMYGDMLAYFGQDQMLVLKPLFEGYECIPVYEETILHKLHNAEALRSAYNAGVVSYLRPTYNSNIDSTSKAFLQNLTHQCIYQFNNVIWNMHTACQGSSTQFNAINGIEYADTATMFLQAVLADNVHILDSYRADFTEETVVEGCLWKPILKELKRTTSPAAYTNLIACCGPEIIESFDVFTENKWNVTLTPVNVLTYYISPTIASVGALVVFDWAPVVYGVTMSGSTSYLTSIYGDVDNARATAFTDIKRILDCAILSCMRSDIVVKIGGSPNTN